MPMMRPKKPNLIGLVICHFCHIRRPAYELELSKIITCAPVYRMPV